MNKKHTITIGGQEYDAVTGLPVSAHTEEQTPEDVPTPAKAAHAAAHHTASSLLHKTTQRSVTLSRKFTKRPAPARLDITTHRAKPAMWPHQAVEASTHPQVRKFAPHPVAIKKLEDTGPVIHPHVAKAHALSAAKAERAQQGGLTTHVAASHVKHEAVAKAVASTHKPTKDHKHRFWQQRQRVSGIVAATFALVLLGGYFTYLNMPSLSVRVAAAQAGVDASYPNYRPDGYALNGPVTYSDGRVSMNFKANSSDAGFTVNQSKSGWDSDAVLDNYVAPRAGSSYVPFTERGLTIYTYDNSAAWVNGGILYTIEGNAPLSNEQIRRIATSLL